MMKCLADMAHLASLKLKHLDEETEYAPLAELIADINLRQSRIRLERFARNQGPRMARLSKSMFQSINMLENHIKNIKIHCKNVTCRRPKPRSMNAVELVTKRTNYEQFKLTVMAFVESINLTKQINIDHSSRAYLIAVSKILSEMYDYIAEHAEYIANEPILRKPIAFQSGRSFMQTLIKKSTQLLNDVENLYRKTRSESLRSDVELRKEKSRAIASLLKAQKLLCKYYQECPVDVEDLLRVEPSTSELRV